MRSLEAIMVWYMTGEWCRELAPCAGAASLSEREGISIFIFDLNVQRRTLKSQLCKTTATLWTGLGCAGGALRAGHLLHSPAIAEGECRQQRPWDTCPAGESALEISLLLSSPALRKSKGGSGGLMMMEWLASQCHVTHNVVACC